MPEFARSVTDAKVMATDNQNVRPKSVPARFRRVVRSNQKKTRATMARSHEDGEEAFTCVNVKRPRSRGNSKKSNLNRLTSNDEAIYSAACRAQSNDSQIYIGAGKLNGRPLKVL